MWPAGSLNQAMALGPIPPPSFRKCLSYRLHLRQVVMFHVNAASTKLVDGRMNISTMKSRTVCSGT